MDKIFIIIPITDMLIQLFICYICVTLGATEALNRFECYMIQNYNGGYELKFVLRKDVPEAVGVLNAVDYSD